MTQAPSVNKTKDWFVYILLCSNGALYTGVTIDVQRRMNEHKADGRLSAHFTRAFAPVRLAYNCRVGAKSLAYRIEYRIKRLPRSKKDLIVANDFSINALIDFLEMDL
jgi:putative endonuclease